jgi:hypothetical protein
VRSKNKDGDDVNEEEHVMDIAKGSIIRKLNSTMMDKRVRQAEARSYVPISLQLPVRGPKSL